MTTEERDDLVIAYLLGELPADARRDFEAELAMNPALRRDVDRLQETCGELLLAVPQQPLPPSLRNKVLGAVAVEPPVANGSAAEKIVPFPRAWLPWALAAGFAVLCGWLLRLEDAQRAEVARLSRDLQAGEAERATLRQQQEEAQREIARRTTEAEQLAERERYLAKEARAVIAQNDELRSTVAMLRGRDTLAQMRIATLSAKLASFATAGVTIVWDQEKQRGVIQIANLPKLAAGKDYQLWVIDPKYPIPVNGGVIRAGDGKLQRVFFQPDQKVDQALQFAITIERTGGVPKAEGPLVFAGS